jgi:hypothetical protein
VYIYIYIYIYPNFRHIDVFAHLWKKQNFTEFGKLMIILTKNILVSQGFKY